MKKVLRWLFGISLFIFSINTLVKGDVKEKFAALLFLIDSLILIPISLNFIEQKLNYKFNRLTKYVLVIILYSVAFGIIFNNTSKDQYSKSKDLNSSLVDTTEKSSIGKENQNKAAEKNIEDHKSGAYLAAQDFVKAKLSYPEEADFPWSPSIPIVVNGDMYKVQGYVDTKNGYGVKIKAKFVCVLKYTGGDDLSPSSWEEQATTVFE